MDKFGYKKASFFFFFFFFYIYMNLLFSIPVSKQKVLFVAPAKNCVIVAETVKSNTLIFLIHYISFLLEYEKKSIIKCHVYICILYFIPSDDNNLYPIEFQKWGRHQFGIYSATIK